MTRQQLFEGNNDISFHMLFKFIFLLPIFGFVGTVSHQFSYNPVSEAMQMWLIANESPWILLHLLLARLGWKLAIVALWQWFAVHSFVSYCQSQNLRCLVSQTIKELKGTFTFSEGSFVRFRKGLFSTEFNQLVLCTYVQRFEHYARERDTFVFVFFSDWTYVQSEHIQNDFTIIVTWK